MSNHSLRFIYTRIKDFCYKFAWGSVSAYTSPLGVGTLTSPTTLNSDTYADDVPNQLSKYRVKELQALYTDSLTGRRRRNVAYTRGPVTVGLSGLGQFDYDWTIYSPVTGGVFLSKAPYASPISYATLYPAYAAAVSGYKPILTATFDLSAQPVLAWESDGTTITTLRITEGLQTFTGYSPTLFSNSGYVSDPSILTDAVVFYLKSVTTPGVWNYDTLTNKLNQAADRRRGNAIYFRVQRDNFGIEYKMCDLPFDVQYLDNVRYDGQISAENPTDTWKQQLSMVNGACSRFTALSAAYYTPPAPSPYVRRNAGPDTTRISVAVSGLLFDVIIPRTVTDTASISTVLSGVLFNSIITQSSSDTASISTVLSGVLFNSIITQSSSDTASILPTVSGSNTDTIVSGGTRTDSFGVTPSVSGSLV